MELSARGDVPRADAISTLYETVESKLWGERVPARRRTPQEGNLGGSHAPSNHMLKGLGVPPTFSYRTGSSA